MILRIQEILPFINKLNFIYSFKNSVLDSGNIEEKILRWETLDLNLLEEIWNVWYIKNCMAGTLTDSSRIFVWGFQWLISKLLQDCVQNESIQNFS